MQTNIEKQPPILSWTAFLSYMFDFLKKLDEKYTELEKQLCDNFVLSDEKKYRSITIELSKIKPTVELYRRLRRLSSETEKNQKLLGEEKMSR